MTDLQIIRECDRIIRLNGGCTPSQLALLIRSSRKHIKLVLDAVPGFYIDRWITAQGGLPQPVYDVVETPASCPKPERNKTC